MGCIILQYVQIIEKRYFPKLVQGHGAPCPKRIKIKLTKIGEIIEDEINKTEKIRNNIKIDNFVIMPDHIHLIIEIKSIGTELRAPTKEKFGKPTKESIPTIIRFIKAIVSKRCKNELNCREKIWQRNYYEHIIRNNKEYNEIYEYIEYNPMRYILKEKSKNVFKN